MKIAIRHPQAPLFWTANGSWSTDPHRALTFLDDVRARDYAFFHDLEEAVPVPMAEPAPSCDLPLALDSTAAA